jgi:hypothetical protein
MRTRKTIPLAGKQRTAPLFCRVLEPNTLEVKGGFSSFHGRKSPFCVLANGGGSSCLAYDEEADSCLGEGSGVARIKDAYLDFDDHSGGSRFTCAMLIILLSDNQVVQAPLNQKTNDRRFAYMRDAPAVRKPQTDGRRVYWQNGASLTLEDIIEMVRTETDEGDAK